MSQTEQNSNEQPDNDAENRAEAAADENTNHSEEMEAETAADPVKEAENKYLYLYAEFENFKKRVEKERTDLRRFGWTPIARDLLDVMDNLTRAVEHIDKSVDSSVSEGLKMVAQEFEKNLSKHGVKKIETEGKEFDPNLHEAVGNVPSPDHAEGAIMHEERAGYLLHDRLLRPSRVLVSAGAP
jgi:molecular chaperone GrpE